ncbi:MAG: YlxM family DNA-binding protein [Syntrophomonadaceae bacterium]|nr:YlxM family DNA-binding protein [Syntrophomonadaceae bacterium]
MLEKISHVVLLKDFYGPLLTQKQQDIMNLHYENDWSLSEIADHMHTSRQAVFDMVKRVQAQLEELEEKLGVVGKFQLTRRRLTEVVDMLDRPERQQADIDQAIKLLRELIGLL